MVYTCNTKMGKEFAKVQHTRKKQQLAKFATEMALECGITEINFGENGIKYHGRGLPGIEREK